MSERPSAMQIIAELARQTGATRCLDCGKCTSTCPMSAWGGFSARRLARQTLVNAAASAEEVTRCLTCGACENRCPERVIFTSFVRGIRATLPPPLRPLCPHAGIFQGLARTGAATEKPRREPSWLKAGLRVAETGKTALFVGCLPYFAEYFGKDLGVQPLEIARAAVRVLNHAGIEPVLLAEERCCGHDLLWGGEAETFATLARQNTDAFAARGIQHIVTACAECARTWRLDYAEAVPTYRPRVEHLSEFMARAIKEGKLHFGEDGTAPVTYQDPCRLGRHLGVTEAPRQVLESLPGTEVREMARSERDAVCCGTTGFVHCDATSRALQESRLAEAAATGAATLVTSCPKCLIHFSCTQAESRRRGLKQPSLTIQDLTVLAAGRLRAAAESPDRKPEVVGSRMEQS